MNKDIVYTIITTTITDIIIIIIITMFTINMIAIVYESMKCS